MQAGGRPHEPQVSGDEAALLGTSKGREGANTAIMTMSITHRGRALPAMSLFV